jgi:hypothetical protein
MYLVNCPRVAQLVNNGIFKSRSMGLTTPLHCLMIVGKVIIIMPLFWVRMEQGLTSNLLCSPGSIILF